MSYQPAGPPDVSRSYAGGSDPDGGVRPDFVLVGLPAPGGIELWASTELTDAELQAETRFRPQLDDPLWGNLADPVPEPVSTTYTLRAGLSKFVIVRAPTYREALAVLLRHPGWGPGGRRAIGGGPGES